MGAIFDMLQGFGNAIIALIDFLVSMVRDLVWMVQLLGQIVPAIPSLFTWLPPALVTSIVTTFSIAVVYKIVGRDG